MDTTNEHHAHRRLTAELKHALQPVRSMAAVAEILGCARATIQLTERRALLKIVRAMAPTAGSAAAGSPTGR